MTVTPGILGDGILPSFDDDLWTASANAYVTQIVASNTGAAARTINFMVYDATNQTDRVITPKDLVLSVGDTLYLTVRAAFNNGDKIRGSADNNTDVDYVIWGGTEA